MAQNESAGTGCQAGSQATSRARAEGSGPVATGKQAGGTVHGSEQASGVLGPSSDQGNL